MATDPRTRARVLEVFGAFLRLGCTSFGGPVAHLGYFRDEFVVRRRWLTDAQYADLVALCQFLPGPASSQVGFGLGLRRAGLAGAVSAWIAFTLPSSLIMLAVAFGAAALTGPVVDGVLRGVLAVAVAVVAHAVHGMRRSLAPDAARGSIAVLAAIAALAIGGVWGQLGVLCGGALAGVALLRPSAGGDGDVIAGRRAEGWPLWSRGAALTSLVLCAVLLAVLPLLAALTRNGAVALVDAVYRAGATVFGGGHVVLATLEAEPALARAIPQDQLLFGYGAAQAVPGPLFSFAAYVGAVWDGGGGGAERAAFALLAIVAIFAPGFLLLLGVLPFWARLQRRPAIAGAMRGIGAAVVGVLAAAFVDPVLVHGVTGWATLALALLSLVALLCRVPPWVIVIAGALCGGAAAVL